MWEVSYAVNTSLFQAKDTHFLSGHPPCIRCSSFFRGLIMHQGFISRVTTPHHLPLVSLWCRQKLDLRRPPLLSLGLVSDRQRHLDAFRNSSSQIRLEQTRPIQHKSTSAHYDICRVFYQLLVKDSLILRFPNGPANCR